MVVGTSVGCKASGTMTTNLADDLSRWQCECPAGLPKGALNPALLDGVGWGQAHQKFPSSLPSCTDEQDDMDRDRLTNNSWAILLSLRC